MTINTPANKLGLGALPSPFDYRDAIAARVALLQLAAKPVPKTPFDTDLSKFGVFNQQGQLACVSNTVALMMKRYWFIKTGKIVDFSPRFIDIMCKRFDGLDRATAGTYARMAFYIATNYGCCTTATLVNDTSLAILDYRNDAAITAQALAEAAKYKIPGYIHIPDDTLALRAACAEYGTLSIGLYIGTELWSKPDGSFSLKDADVDPMRPPAAVIGGHQLILKGLPAPTMNRLRNSWGEEYADHGEINYDANLWARYTQEAWTIASVPSDIRMFLADLPSPTDFRYQWRYNMTLGDNNEDVKFLQVAYMILGLLAPLTPDEFGYFGPKTLTANGRYQQLQKISPVPARCGPQTRTELNALFAV